jgi:hypothetical protein
LCFNQQLSRIIKWTLYVCFISALWCVAWRYFLLHNGAQESPPGNTVSSKTTAPHHRLLPNSLDRLLSICLR